MREKLILEATISFSLSFDIPTSSRRVSKKTLLKLLYASVDANHECIRVVVFSLKKSIVEAISLFEKRKLLFMFFLVPLPLSMSFFLSRVFTHVQTWNILNQKRKKNWKISLRWWKMGNSRMILCENLLILFYVKLPDEWLRGIMMTRHWTKNGTRKYNFSIKPNNVSYKTLKYVKSALNNSILHTHTLMCTMSDDNLIELNLIWLLWMWCVF